MKYKRLKEIASKKDKEYDQKVKDYRKKIGAKKSELEMKDKRKEKYLSELIKNQTKIEKLSHKL